MAEYKWGGLAHKQTRTATAKPAAKKAPAKPAKRKAKPKPVGYLVTLHNGTQLQTEGPANTRTFRGGLAKDGLDHDEGWYPFHTILRVDRRD